MCAFIKDAHFLQAQKLGIIVLGLLLTLTSTSNSQTSDHPNECERGVKRHHPSQANVYQVFTRQGYQKQWLDFSCPELSIFDPRQCACVEGGSQPEQQEQRQSRQRNKKRQRRPEPPRQDPGAEESRPDYRQEFNSRDYQQSPKSGWQQQQQQQPQHQQQQQPQHQQQQQPEQKQGDWSRQQEAKDYQVDPGYYEEKPTEFQARPKYDENSIGRNRAKPEADCYLHRPTKNPSLFERWSDGQWVEEDCNWPFYTGLVWNQQACRCEWGPNRTVAVPMVGESVPASCLMMLKMTFDRGDIVDEGRHIWLNIRNKDSASVEDDSSAVGGKCGAFRGSSIAVPYFKSNVLGSVFHIGFMFKLCPGDPDTDIPLIHNDCIESGHEGPSLMVTYQAWKNQVTVAIRSVNSENLVSVYCLIGNSQKPWTKLDIRYGDSYLEVMANDQVCAESNKLYGPVATNNCPLTLLGEAFCGNLDEVIITRGCTDAHAVS